MEGVRTQFLETEIESANERGREREREAREIETRRDLKRKEAS